ncbi:four helix bundle protein [Chryseobacterium piperi]|uniref:four helix bundle protein n=1 Tax=Chryseobacterium piperi TaxID=558152 RepID=UPI000A0670D6|nr:four helix bundle protein [Chryseobacterium piperi]ASW74926.1 four helix bundle protein [Chryseobacterium piperi]
MGNYKELIVWQKSVDLVTEVYSYTKNFPKEEMYGLTNQIRRSSISIPSNIAEGHSRRSQADYIQFLKIARGSCAELDTQLIISKNLRACLKK